MSGWSLVLLLLEVLLLLVGLYLLALTIAGFFYRPPRPMSGFARSRFAVLVPAHNEELALPRLLASLRETDYPPAFLRVYVVADNCADSTAAAARSRGAIVFERSDQVRVGKGYALQWLLREVRATGDSYDAYVLLDADCQVSRNFFGIMDARLRAGSKVVQAYYAVANALETPVSTLRYIALVLMHLVRGRGRQALGLSCGIFGTGIVFRRDVLDNLDWDTFGLTEDIEYHLKLVDGGIRVAFAPEATVLSEMPRALREARSQNLRWEAGRLQAARRHSVPLLMRGLRRGDWARVDAALQQAIPPLSITVPLALIVLLVALATHRTAPLVLPAGAAVVALSAHIVIGLSLAKLPIKAYGCALYVPWFVLWKFALYLRAFQSKDMPWVRTPRPSR